MHHGRIDYLACGRSVVHRLDSRTKLLGTILFTVFVIMQEPTAVSVIACFGVWPFAVLVVGGIPLRFAAKQILMVSPFVAVLAVSCLFYDRGGVEVVFGPVRFETTAGVLRCVSIVARFVVTMAALIGLVATTRFNDLLAGMAKLGVPKILIMQLGFLYRYIFLLIDCASHMLQARAGRRLRNLGVRMELKTAASMVGALVLNSLDMAERVNTAMQARGFDGRLHAVSRGKPGVRDLIFTVLLTGFVVVVHFVGRGI